MLNDFTYVKFFVVLTEPALGNFMLQAIPITEYLENENPFLTLSRLVSWEMTNTEVGEFMRALYVAIGQTLRGKEVNRAVRNSFPTAPETDVDELVEAIDFIHGKLALRGLS